MVSFLTDIGHSVVNIGIRKRMGPMKSTFHRVDGQKFRKQKNTPLKAGYSDYIQSLAAPAPAPKRAIAAPDPTTNGYQVLFLRIRVASAITLDISA